MPAAKTLQDQLTDALERTPGAAGLESLLRRLVRARGHEVLDPEDRQLIRDRANAFVFSHDGRQAWGRFEGRSIDGGEAVRQAVNSLCVQLETEPDPVGQDLTPLEVVIAKRKASGIYAMGVIALCLLAI